MEFDAAALRAIVVEQSTVVIVECRHCGTSVDPEAERCPACGATELSSYELRSPRLRLTLRRAVAGVLLLLAAVVAAGLGLAVVAGLGP